MQQAGGLNESADLKHIHITRRDPLEELNVDLWKVIFNGDVTEDRVVRSRDMIYVPQISTGFSITNEERVENPNKARVLGSVNHPGLFTIQYVALTNG